MKQTFNFILICFIFSINNAYSRCASFSQMVERISGMERGTPISAQVSNGTKVNGTLEDILVDPVSKQSYMVVRDHQGKLTSHWVADFNPSSFSAPLDNIVPGSSIQFLSKSNRVYEGKIIGREVIRGEDVFKLQSRDGVVSNIRVARVNENSIKVSEVPVKRIYLPANSQRAASPLDNGDFVSLEIPAGRYRTSTGEYINISGSSRMPAQVKEIRTGTGGSKVSVEVLVSENFTIRLNGVYGNQLASVRR